MGNLEIRIDRNRNKPCRPVDADNRRKISKGIPSPVIRRDSRKIDRVCSGKVRDRGIGCLQELIRCEASQLLHVAHIDYTVGRNWRMTWRYHTI